MGKELMMYGVPIKIYAVNGAPRSGKDTLIDRCIYFIENLYYKEVKKEIGGGKGEILLYKWSEYNKLGSPIKYSVIDPIKKILEPIEPIEKEKTLRKRQILSDLKDFLDERLNFTQKEIFNFLKKEVREAKRRNEEELIVFIIAREDKDINFLKTWDSLAEAGRAFNAKTGSNITSVCKGERKSAYGYKWKYTNE